MALTQESSDSIRVLQDEEHHFTSKQMGQRGLQTLQRKQAQILRKGTLCLLGDPMTLFVA